MQPSPEQIQYVKNEIARGVSESDLRAALTGAGYGPALIDQLWAAAHGAPAADAAPALSELPKKKSSFWKSVLVVLAVLGGLVLLLFLAMTIFVGTALNDARDKGEDAATKAQLNNFRALAELYYDGNDLSYGGVCGEVRLETADCIDSPTEYRVSAVLNNGNYYCIDSIGNADELVVQPISTQCKEAEMSDAVETNTMSAELMEETTALEGEAPNQAAEEIPEQATVEDVMSADAGLEYSKDEASDAQLKMSLNMVRANAEIFYDENNLSYTGLCEGAAGISILQCQNTADSYVMYAGMSDQSLYCVDSTGFAGMLLEVPQGPACN